MARLKRLFRLTAAIVLAAIVITVLVAWGNSVCIDVSLANPRSADAMTGEAISTVQRWDRQGATYVVWQSLREWGWSPSQATGAPDTPAPGDQQSAWASLTADGQREWLCLEYARTVLPKSVRIYESYCPGAVDRVTAFSADGKEFEAWHGVDPTPPTAPSGISEIPLRIDFPTRKLTLHLNSPAVSGWNEIDAVQLVGATGDLQWARRATASSSYGAPLATAASVAAVQSLLPSWGGLERFAQTMASDDAQTETRAVDGRGWPLVALWCERDPSTGAAIAGALGSVRKPAAASVNATGRAHGNLSYSLAIAAAPLRLAALSPALPIRIAWQGFFADIVFYAVALAALRWLIIRPWRLTAELSRMRRGCCLVCGYDLGYDFRTGCPECGWRRNDLES